MAKQIVDQPVTVERLEESLRTTVPRHPALNRLRGRMIASADVSAAITSYDRMHHRHNRS